MLLPGCHFQNRIRRDNMERLTEYHAGKAVIKDKSLLPDAMEKLARYEDREENRVSVEEFIMKRFTEVR